MTASPRPTCPLCIETASRALAKIRGWTLAEAQAEVARRVRAMEMPR